MINKICPKNIKTTFDENFKNVEVRINSQAYFEGDNNAEYVRTIGKLTGMTGETDRYDYFEVILFDGLVAWFSDLCFRLTGNF